jgi:hypothetical protein
MGGCEISQAKAIIVSLIQPPHTTHGLLYPYYTHGLRDGVPSLPSIDAKDDEPIVGWDPRQINK